MGDRLKPLPSYDEATDESYEVYRRDEVDQYIAEAKLIQTSLEDAVTRRDKGIADLRKHIAGQDELIAEYKKGYQLAAEATGYDGDWFDAAPIRALIAERDQHKSNAMTAEYLLSETTRATESPWVDVNDRLPDAGIQVLVRRQNSTWDRGECNPLYFDGLPAWYLPEGPTLTEGTKWMPIPRDEG